MESKNALQITYSGQGLEPFVARGGAWEITSQWEPTLLLHPVWSPTGGWVDWWWRCQEPNSRAEWNVALLVGYTVWESACNSSMKKDTR